MDRRPISEDQGRIKRRKTEAMDSRYNGESDDDGGVKLENYGHTPKIKPKKEDPNAKPSRYTEGNDTPVEKSSSKKRKKEEDSDDESNPYVAKPYGGPASKKDFDPRVNPYLAHRYEEPAEDEGNFNGYTNGYARTIKRTDGALKASSLAGLPRHKSTAAIAQKAEDGPNNPFNGQPLSSQYFSILKTRRNLPVHQQRYARFIPQQECHVLTPCIGTSSYRCIKGRNFSYSSEKLVPARPPKYPNLYFSMTNHMSSASWWLARSLVELQRCQWLNA